MLALVVFAGLASSAYGFGTSVHAGATRVGVSPATCRSRHVRCGFIEGLAPDEILTNPNLLSTVGVGVVAAAASVLSKLNGPVGAPYAPKADAYDPVAAEEYYSARPLAVASRLFKLLTLTGALNARLALDFAAYKRAGSPEGEPWPNEPARAKEALSLATQLGPTFIKLAQALSIRTDLIPEAYALELRQLQDAVPPFSSLHAKDILARELGVTNGPQGLRSVFDDLSDEPLAAASIGQVYKGRLPDGREVAVKVQRPDILDEIALDLHLLRLIAPLQTRISNAVNKVRAASPRARCGLAC